MSALPDVHTLDLDPWSPENLRDPVPMQRTIRDAGAVVYLPQYDIHVVGRHAEVKAVLDDGHSFISSAGVGLVNFNKEAPFRCLRASQVGGLMKVHLIQPDGTTRTLDVAAGTTVMQAATSAGVRGIVGECGGSAMCATCHVYVEEACRDKLPPISPPEEEMLECTASERLPSSRLSCQLELADALDGLTVRLPETQQ